MNKSSVVKVIPYFLLVGYSFVSNIVLNNGAVYREYIYLVSKVESAHFSLFMRLIYILVLSLYLYYLARKYAKSKDLSYLISVPLIVCVVIHLIIFKDYNEQLDYVLKAVYLLLCSLFDLFSTVIYVLLNRKSNSLN